MFWREIQIGHSYGGLDNLKDDWMNTAFSVFLAKSL